MSKKIIALVLILALGMFNAFALELMSAGDTYPLDTDVTVTYYADGSLFPHDSYADWTQSPFHTNISKVTGINVEWVLPTTGADGNAFTNALLADPANMPNILRLTKMNEAQDFIDRGLIWDISDYIEEYAPAYYSFLKSNPAYDKAMKTDKGQYYCFGFFREDGGWNDTYLGPVVRTDWMEEQGLEAPKTISEFENVIRVFNEAYGAKFAFAWSRFNTTGISGAFGAYGASDFQVYVDDGEIKLAQIQPEWRDYVSWLAKLWAEGLLDQDSLSETDTTIKTKVHDDKIGISITSMGQMNNWNQEEIAAGREPVWAGIQYPTSDEGELSMVFGGSGIGNVTTMISKRTDEETMILCLKLLDYAYTQEGFYFWNFGVQGESWDFTADGEVDYLPAIKEENKGVNDFTVKYGGATWGANCIQATKLLYLKNSEASIAANNIWFYPNQDVTAYWKWPSGTTFTVAENEEVSALRSTISTRVSEAFANFISGSADINDDAAWDAYLKEIESMNVDRLLEIYQSCYERYLER